MWLFDVHVPAGTAGERMKLVMTLLVRTRTISRPQPGAPSRAGHRSLHRHRQPLPRFHPRVSGDMPSCRIIEEPGETYDQARWVTRMAERTAASGADWVIHCDADEFWIARQQCRLRDQVWRCPLISRCNWQHGIPPSITSTPGRNGSIRSTGLIRHPRTPSVSRCLESAASRPAWRCAQGNHSSAGLTRRCIPENHELVILHFRFRGIATRHQDRAGRPRLTPRRAASGHGGRLAQRLPPVNGRTLTAALP